MNKQMELNILKSNLCLVECRLNVGLLNDNQKYKLITECDDISNKIESLELSIALIESE